MARCTRARTSGRMWAYWLRTRDTVARETRARRATSATVGERRCCGRSAKGPVPGKRFETGFKNECTIAETCRACQAERLAEGRNRDGQGEKIRLQCQQRMRMPGR